MAASLVLFVLLIWVLVASSAAVLRARRRQRELLSLLGHGDPKVPGALVVDHPAAAAYCVPGLRSRIVVSAGTLELLDQAELAAVLAHERAHLRERHDLVLLPFTALLRAFRWSPAARDAAGSVALLLEMLADDHAVGYVAAAAAAGGGGAGASGRPGRWPWHCSGWARPGRGRCRAARWPWPTGGTWRCGWRGCSPRRPGCGRRRWRWSAARRRRWWPCRPRSCCCPSEPRSAGGPAG